LVCWVGYLGYFFLLYRFTGVSKKSILGGWNTKYIKLIWEKLDHKFVGKFHWNGSGVSTIQVNIGWKEFFVEDWTDFTPLSESLLTLKYPHSTEVDWYCRNLYIQKVANSEGIIQLQWYMYNLWCVYYIFLRSFKTKSV